MFRVISTELIKLIKIMCSLTTLFMISLLQMEVESSVQPEIWQRFQDLQQFDVFYTPLGPFCWSLHVICWKPSEVSKQLHLLSTENRATTWSCVGLSNNCTCFQSTDVPSLGSLSFTFQASGRLLLAQNHQFSYCKFFSCVILYGSSDYVKSESRSSKFEIRIVG